MKERRKGQEKDAVPPFQIFWLRHTRNVLILLAIVFKERLCSSLLTIHVFWYVTYSL